MGKEAIRPPSETGGEVERKGVKRCLQAECRGDEASIMGFQNRYHGNMRCLLRSTGAVNQVTVRTSKLLLSP